MDIYVYVHIYIYRLDGHGLLSLGEKSVQSVIDEGIPSR